jgi:hypothetical protein
METADYLFAYNNYYIDADGGTTTWFRIPAEISLFNNGKT